MSEPSNSSFWIDRAEEDFILAQAALRRKRPLTNSACFLAQQCAEKYFKAALVARGKDFPKTHDLVLLNLLCEQVGIFIGMTPDQLGMLTSFSVRARYPGTEPTIEEARSALATAKVIRRYMRTLLG